MISAKSIIATLAAIGLVGLVGCENKPAETKPEDTASKNAPTTSATAAQATPVAVTIAETDLSTPADFEEVAEKAITKTNYKTELATLEADVAKE